MSGDPLNTVDFWNAAMRSVWVHNGRVNNLERPFRMFGVRLPSPDGSMWEGGDGWMTPVGLLLDADVNRLVRQPDMTAERIYADLYPTATRDTWADIAFAPKTGERIILLWAGVPAFGHWECIEGHPEGGEWVDDGFCLLRKLTAWMPSPKQPSDQWRKVEIKG